VTSIRRWRAKRREHVGDQIDIKVSDEDIQKIIDANQAGTADLMAFYESAEASYVAAAEAAMPHPPTAAYPASSDTIPLN